MGALGWRYPSFMRAVRSLAALPISIWPQAISYLRPSSAADLVRPVIACLVAVYGAEFGRGLCAEMEPLLMMRPPRGTWLFMSRNASWVQRKVPVRLVWTTAVHRAYVRSSSGTGGAPIPALLNSRSRRPKTSLVRANRLPTDEGSVTSVGATSVRDSEAAIARAVASSRSLTRPARTTENPSSSSARVTALPTPVPAPVTMAILFADSIYGAPFCSAGIPEFHASHG